MSDKLELLRAIKIENGEITAVEAVKSKPIENFGITLWNLPDHYRVCVRLKPTIESNILVEILLPENGWNGNFLGTGNGGFAGTIETMGLFNGLCRGYATANTDMGTSSDIDNFIGKPEVWADFGHRATHLMTVVSKQIIKAFYGKEAKHSYFIGGSTGGQQALMTAQRYPYDYNGIIAFDPANNRVKLHASFVWNWLALTQNPKAMIDQETASKITKAVVNHYAISSGSAPGDDFITYPDRFKIDLKILKKDAGLNSVQVAALEKIYSGAVDSITGERIFTPIVFGSEDGGLGISTISQKESTAKDFFYIFRWILGKDFDFSKFDFHKDLETAIERLSPVLDAVDPDLSAFKNKGGKLMMICGTADPIIPYTDANQYYESVVKKQGGLDKTMAFFRYFLVPGMGHVFGGPGLQILGSLGFSNMPKDKDHDAISAIAEWVENNNAPDRMRPVAFEEKRVIKAVSFCRPVYCYPAETEYIGGDRMNEDSFRKKEVKLN